MGARLTTALVAGKAAALLSRRLGLGGGTVIAGHIVPFIEPRALRTIVARLPEGAILVSGTNGKTTTSRLIAHLLRHSGRRVLHNRAGANLLTGLVSAVVEGSSLFGNPHAEIAIFEVDEATLPGAIEAIQPRVLALTNLFRDQLDRYGEVRLVAELWGKSLRQLSEDTVVALNADDPLVAGLGKRLRTRTLYYGIDALEISRPEPEHAADARLCAECGTRYRYSATFYGHLGHYRCPACLDSRPTPQVTAIAVRERGLDGTHLQVDTFAGAIECFVPLPGLYNVYNSLAAVTVALACGLTIHQASSSLQNFHAAFGRLERLSVADRELVLTLVKNPVGFNQVLRTLSRGERLGTFVILINDLFADGTDISWLWDVDFELLAGRAQLIVCSGTRAEDMALRLKYAMVPLEAIRIEPLPAKALELAVELTPPGDVVYVLPTYTAMLEVREALRRAGHVGGFWED